MPEAGFNQSHSFNSYVDDELVYDVVARVDGSGAKLQAVFNTEVRDSSRISELSVDHLHHFFGESDQGQDGYFGLGFLLKKRQKASTYSTSGKLRGAFKLLQKWSGYVTEIKGDEFVAILKDKTNPNNPDEEVVLAIDELSPSDQRSLAVGSEFFWSIGYETNSSGSRFRKSEVRLRRLAPFCREELNYARQKADEMESLFEGL